MDNTELVRLMSSLRKLASRYSAQIKNISPKELRDGKTMAAKCYLSHNAREITLSNEQFQLVVDILKIKD